MNGEHSFRWVYPPYNITTLLSLIISISATSFQGLRFVVTNILKSAWVAFHSFHKVGVSLIFQISTTCFGISSLVFEWRLFIWCCLIRGGIFCQESILKRALCPPQISQNAWFWMSERIWFVLFHIKEPCMSPFHLICRFSSTPGVYLHLHI